MPRLFEVEVRSLSSAAELMSAVEALVDRRTPSTVGYVNAHVLNLAARDSALLETLQSLDLCYADGFGVVLASRILRDPLPGRLTGADFIWDLARMAERRRWRVAWVAGRDGVVDRAGRVLRERHPGLNLVYTHDGYDPTDLTPGIREARPDLLLVGMGTPTQERWIARHRASLPQVPVVWALGATHDFVAGEVSRGPAWLHSRQEWVARLLVDPRRLWKRYLLGNPRFLARTIRVALSADRRETP